MGATGAVTNDVNLGEAGIVALLALAKVEQYTSFCLARGTVCANGRRQGVGIHSPD